MWKASGRLKKPYKERNTKSCEKQLWRIWAVAFQLQGVKDILQKQKAGRYLALPIFLRLVQCASTAYFTIAAPNLENFLIFRGVLTAVAIENLFFEK